MANAEIQKAKSAANAEIKKMKSTYPEIEDIQEDLNSLKENTVQLAKHVKADSAEQVHVLSEKAHDAIADLKTQGLREIEKVEKRVKQKPGQSLALAFAAGVVASFLLGRRR